LPEVREEDFLNAGGDAPPEVDLPVLLNGQIMPGEVDHYRLRARRGRKLVIRLQARRLIPYLADAVPGWFQAVISLHDPAGREVAYDDDFRFDPDPVLMYQVPEDGLYELVVRDAIYRGRDDFVYRISAGELPFVTGIFPLGGRVNTPATVSLTGWNLPADTLQLDTGADAGFIRWARVGAAQGLLNEIPYAVDEFPEVSEVEPNDSSDEAQQIDFPQVVNGRIGHAGDMDVFRFTGRAGQEIVVETWARRLNSPLDSVLRLADAAGGTVAVNDDYKDLEMGLVTHQADSYLRVELPQDGDYLVYVADTQRHGGDDYAYRLRLRPAQPDFALRLVPSAINVRAGQSAPVTIHVVRKDGFEGDVDVALVDAPEGFALNNAHIPAGEESVQATVSAPRGAPRLARPIRCEGRASIGGATVTRPAVPAEDMMQAFLWRFLVPRQELIVAIAGARPVPIVWRPLVPGVRLTGGAPVRIPLGETARVRFTAPQALPDRPEVSLDAIGFRLGNRPRGVTLRGATVEAGSIVLTLKADANIALAGDKGNAIIEAFVDPPAGADGHRIYLGVLPAIPFEVVRP
ncbi:MAG: PPC domain-containing protein, partial [Armatimonadetes bacterium]|nr:PPC domain-containing protein [Armatimonadota bacterium]